MLLNQKEVKRLRKIKRVCKGLWGCHEIEYSPWASWENYTWTYGLYSCLKNSMDRGAWWATVHGVTKSWTWLNMHTHTYDLKDVTVCPVDLGEEPGRGLKVGASQKEARMAGGQEEGSLGFWGFSSRDMPCSIIVAMLLLSGRRGLCSACPAFSC